MATTEAPMPTYALEVTPESELRFTLTRSPPAGGTVSGGAGGTASSTDGSSPRCTMTLRHLGATDEHLAFKVKTTQPRRYLVRPNQGIVAPNSSENVSIILVEKDKQILLQSYDRLGQSALDHSKDKFLVQSCAVSNDFASRYMTEKAKADQQAEGNKTAKDLAEALTTMWNSVTSEGNIPIFNKKLHVRHVVPPGEAALKPLGAQPPLLPEQQGATAAGGAAAAALKPPTLQTLDKQQPIESMTPEQMFAEVSALRRKYDELVSFSVNLTAERDILNNTLEQTKRDLNREMASRAALENKLGGGAGGAGGNSRQRGLQSPKAGGFALSLIQVLIVAIACFLAGIKAANSGALGFLGGVPLLSTVVGAADIHPGGDDVGGGIEHSGADAVPSDVIDM